MILKGFRFGMLLQFAIGPMCLMVFNSSATHGFWTSILLVLAIALVDGIYIALSCFGVAAIISKEQVRHRVKWLGCIVLVLFGSTIIMQACHISILPNIMLFSDVSGGNIFIQGLLLTASNPLTIIFWSGALSAQVTENNYRKKQLVLFGLGCVLSTVFFLTVVAFCGSLLKGFLPQLYIQVLNAIVGIILIYFGIRLLVKK